MRTARKEEIDDRINVRVGEELKQKLDALAASDPGDPGVGVIVRRLLIYGLEHMIRCDADKKKER